MSVLRCVQKENRLLLLTPSLDYGGAEVLIVQLAIHMAQRGWSVCVISMMHPRAFAERLTDHGVEVVSLGMQPKHLNLRGIISLVREIRRFRPSVIHTHMFHANILARLLKPTLRSPLVCTIHNIVESSRTRSSSPLRDMAYRFTDRMCDRTTAVAETVRSRFINEGLADPTRLRTIPNGVDTSRFRPNPRARTRIRKTHGWEESFVWLAVGRLELAKDYPTMLRAFQQVRGRYPAARLAIAGSGRLEQELKGFVSQAGLTSHIDFLGTSPNVADLLTACDGYVMSSAWEGTPIALLEACSSALPIVATDTGVVSEIIISGESGFIAPIGDVGQLAKGMSDVMAADPADRRRFGEHSRRCIVEKFSIDCTLRQYEQCYVQMLPLNAV